MELQEANAFAKNDDGSANHDNVDESLSSSGVARLLAADDAALLACTDCQIILGRLAFHRGDWINGRQLFMKAASYVNPFVSFIDFWY
jgi:hypothetical protein